MKLILILLVAVSANAVNIQEFPGTNWCMQVNAADSALAGISATLVVPSSVSGVCSTQIKLSSNHSLHFGPGTFNLGLLNGRSGILIDHGVSNVSIAGEGIGSTELIFTSFNIGSGNIFPWGSAVGIGTITSCSNPSDPSNNISISGITFSDQQTLSELSSAHNPSIIDGACVNDITIEHNEFTNAKGNAAVTIAGKWNTQGGQNYRNLYNKYDGTAAGNWGEFAADNSYNFTNIWWTGNNVSGYRCSAFGMSGIFRVTVNDNIIDQTVVGSSCAAIGIGADANIGHVSVANNTIFINATSVGPCIHSRPAGSSADAVIDIQNNRCFSLGGTVGTGTAGIFLYGVNSGTAPTQIVRGNYIDAAYPILASGPQIGNVEISDNVMEGVGNDQDILDCAGPVAIIAGSTIRVYENKINAGQIARQCTDPSFASSAFSHWKNTIDTNTE